MCHFARTVLIFAFAFSRITSQTIALGSNSNAHALQIQQEEGMSLEIKGSTKDCIQILDIFNLLLPGGTSKTLRTESTNHCCRSVGFKFNRRERVCDAYA